MKLRSKITLWFSLFLILVIASTYVVILVVSDRIMEKTTEDNLIETVDNNLDEIEYFASIVDAKEDKDGDQYLSFGKGFLEIDDDFLDKVNGISTSLYTNDMEMLYGENPIIRDTMNIDFLNGDIQKVRVDGSLWYVYDRELKGYNLDGLYLRGIVSNQAGSAQLSSITKFSLILMPLLVIFAIIGGYTIAGRSLRPITEISRTASEIYEGRDLKKRIGLGTGKDEVHQLANAFDSMFDRLDSSFAAEQQFTSDASHELRTPISVIMAQCEYSLESDRDADEYRNALRTIRRQGGRMKRMVDDLLTFTRMESKGSSIAFEKVPLSQLINSICTEMSPLAEKNIIINSDIQQDVFINGNYDLLSRLMTNLITNGYRYGVQDGHIAVGLRSEGDRIIVSVSDDGIGIPEESREKIFNRFYQVDSSRNANSTGLGLAMVKEIVTLHGGQIHVDSTLGKGSSFTITF